MSVVISFRLNKDDPRQMKAILLLNRKRAEGMSVREVIITALIQIDQGNQVNEKESDIQLVRETLTRVNLLLANMNIEQEGQETRPKLRTDLPKLASDFICSVKTNFKPGMGPG